MAASEVLKTNGATPATPASGKTKEFVNASKHFSTVDDAGLVLDFVSGGAAATSSPGDPSGTTDTTGKMMGLAGSFTPSFSGRVLIMLSGNIASSAAADGAAVQISYGTGAAPSNAGALTGTAVGSIEQITTANANASKYPFCCVALVTGLTLATAYWVDARLKAITAGTASITSVTIVAVEL